MSKPATSTASKRIKKEIADLSKENLGEISLTPNEADIFAWKAVIPGPIGSPYEGGRFEVDIRIPPDYPFSAPKLHFLTKVYHCNIAHTGAICLDLLKGAWSPALSLYKVILSLSSLLTDPNPSDPLVPSIASEYRTKRKQHDETARAWVKLYATPKDTVDPYSTPPVTASTAMPPPPSAPGRQTGRIQPAMRAHFRAVQQQHPEPAQSVQPPAQSSVAVSRKRQTHTRATTSQGIGSTTTSNNEPIDLASESEAEDEVEVDQSIEILGENPASRNQASGSNGSRTARQPPPRKRARQAREDSDEVIFIDD